MKFIDKIDITDSILTSSSITEDDHGVWDSGTTYAIGDYVIVTTGYHQIYYCEVANTDKDPTDDDNIYDDETDPDNPTGYWTLISATNRWKMFDSKSASLSVDTDEIDVSLTPSETFNSVGIANMSEVDYVRVIVTDPVDGEVYNNEVEMVDLSGISDFYDWFFSPISNKKNVYLGDLPVYADSTVSFEISGDGEISVGELVVGTSIDCGDTVYGTSYGSLVYSTKEDDESGDSSIQDYGFKQTVTFSTNIFYGFEDFVYRSLARYVNDSTIYSGSDDSDATIVYGFYNDFDIVTTDYKYSTLSIQVEELV